MMQDRATNELFRAVYAGLEEISLLLLLGGLAYEDEIEERLHIVRPGETLWQISKDYLGDGYLYPRLQAANPDIIDANRIYPGQHIVIPIL